MSRALMTMAQPAAFKATYSDFKLIKTRQCVQIIFEVPLAAYDDAAKVLGGLPNPAAERWFAIAALKAEVSAKPVAEPETKERKSWRDLPPSQQAAMRCNEPVFCKFLEEKYPTAWRELDDAAELIRSVCGVQSRRELDTMQPSRVIWHQLDSQYQAWLAKERVGA
jgi:hypothetical protein